MAASDDDRLQSSPTATIRVRGARVHNLRDVDVDLPRDRLVVLTGVSGSGKSSLAFDTLYAEGQRRYIESLSSYARQFLDQLERPDVDLIEGLPPTVSIDQRAGSTNPRSTVATLTEIHDYLRLLYARTGIAHCPGCGQSIRRQTPEQMVATVLGMSEGRKVLVLAPLVRGRKGQHLDAFQAIRRAGLLRARVDGQIVELGDDPPKLAKTKVHHVEAVVDRLVVREGIRPRLAESIGLALKLAEGSIVLAAQAGTEWEDHRLSVRYACPSCGIGFDALEPRSFSFNSPYGACPSCDGLGFVSSFDPESSKTELRRAALEPFRERTPCPACGGARLRPESRSVTVAERGIHEVAMLPITEALPFFAGLVFDPPLDLVGPPLVREIVRRLAFLDRVGLGYLTLAREADTLSGGELQRVRLATQIGSGLIGVCYILDEPTAGLHPRDTGHLLDTLFDLRDQGNTIVVVEHDEATIRASDWLIDLGPGAGLEGGLVVATGRPNALAATGESLTTRYLNQEHRTAFAESGRLKRSAGALRIVGASARNLKGIDVRIPLGTLTCVSGVSGSGKSTLVHDVLARAVRRALKLPGPRAGAHERIEGLASITQLIEIDQSPIGRGPRSTPSTYTGVFDEIRKVFARTREAKLRGYSASRFSFNVKGGRCEVCEGQGVRKIAMNFLPDMFVPCEACRTLRFNRQTLEVRFKGLSIGDVLALRVDAARAFFDVQPKVLQGLDALHEAGLGYITLGQSSTTLSGGEAQRVKLAAELGRSATGQTLYILDEPTTGLHFADVERLLGVLVRLADQGNTIVVIEHNLDVIRASDWVIDLGPDGGDAGGRLVGMGTPRTLSETPGSDTGRFLR